MKVEDLKLEMFGSVFKLNGVDFNVPAPGMYNIENALASVRVAMDFGVTLEQCAAGLKKFRGIQRRFALAGQAGGVTVVDDYAHNPAKISAVLGALRAAPGFSGRLVAIYQPHGYAPTRLLRRELADAFTASLTEKDILLLPEIYYAGGTVAKDISAKDLAADISARGRTALYFSRRKDIIPKALEIAAPGDIFVVMGARDWTLSDFAAELFEAIKKKWM
jgi:UDP-N-acetylmuramate--alanine ligase